MTNPIHALGAWFARNRAERTPLSEADWAAIERPAARAGESPPSEKEVDAAAVLTADEQVAEEETAGVEDVEEEEGDE